MSWANTLQDASFRGVPFEVLGVGDEGGKTLAVIQLPYVNGARVDDMGNEPEAIAVRALLRGDDYETRLQSLLNALRTQGHGELVHPIFGALRVLPLRWRVEHEAERRDQAELSIQFLEDKSSQPALFNAPAAQSSADRVATLGEQARDQAAESVSSIVETIAGGPLPRVTEINAAFSTARAKLSTLLDTTSVRVLQADLDVLLYPRSAMTDLRAIVDGAFSGLPMGGLNAQFSGSSGDGVSMGAAVSDFNRLAGTQNATVTIAPISSEPQDTLVSAALTAASRVMNATAVANAATIILAAELDLLALERAEIERLAAVARTNLQAAMVSARQALDAQRGAQVAMTLAQAAHQVQEAARAALEQRPPVITTAAPVGGHARLLAHSLYGDHTRASELTRLNAWGRQVLITAGEEVQAYAR